MQKSGFLVTRLLSKHGVRVANSEDPYKTALLGALQSGSILFNEIFLSKNVIYRNYNLQNIVSTNKYKYDVGFHKTHHMQEIFEYPQLI